MMPMSIIEPLSPATHHLPRARITLLVYYILQIPAFFLLKCKELLEELWFRNPVIIYYYYYCLTVDLSVRH
jgi:hypothetical protein